MSMISCTQVMLSPRMSMSACAQVIWHRPKNVHVPIYSGDTEAMSSVIKLRTRVLAQTHVNHLLQGHWDMPLSVLS